MSNEFGHGILPVDGAQDVVHALAEADRPRHGDSKGPADWAKKNLFNTWYNSIITVVFGLIAAYGAYRLGRFLFVTARWEPVRQNMELFMIGLFPREERTRLIVQIIMFCGAGGLLIGYFRNRSYRQAAEAGIERPPTSARELASIYGALAAFFTVALVIGARTINPWLVALACVAAGVAGFVVTVSDAPIVSRVVVFVPFGIAAGILTRVDDLDNAAAYSIAAATAVLLALVAFVPRPPLTLSAGLLVGVLGFQALSGTGGIAWFFLGIGFAPIVLDLVGVAAERARSAGATTGTSLVGWAGVVVTIAALVWRGAVGGISLVTIVLVILTVAAVADAVRGVGDSATRIGGFVVAGFLGWALASYLDLGGIDWSGWNGLHLNIVVASASIVLAFPIGLLLALVAARSCRCCVS